MSDYGWRTVFGLMAIAGLYLCGFATARGEWLAVAILGASGVYALIKSQQ